MQSIVDRLLMKIVGWIIPAVIGLIVLGLASLAWHHESLVSQHARQARKLAPLMLHTPGRGLSDWSIQEQGLTPPEWRGMQLSTRLTKITAIPETSVSGRDANNWGSWFIGEMDKPLVVKVSAQNASSPLHIVPGAPNPRHGYPNAEDRIVQAEGWSPSSLNAVLDSGHATITNNNDGTATITVPPPVHDKAVVWVWATSASNSGSPPVTTVSVGTSSWATVHQINEWVGSSTMDGESWSVMMKCLIVGLTILGFILASTFNIDLEAKPTSTLPDMPPPAYKPRPDRI